jgi:N-acetylneuraminate synthase
VGAKLKKMNQIKIKNKVVQDFKEPYIIAEIGANHNGDMNLAKKMIISAKENGADAVKFQSWTPSSIVSKEEYDRNQKYDDGDGGKKHFGSLREMVEKYYLREDQHFELKTFCDEIGITFSSTPFSKYEVDLLEKCDVPFYKIASMDINNYYLLEQVSEKQRPVILSTGMSTISEIDKAVSLLYKNNIKEIALLHCISIYPPLYEDINLNNIQMLRQTFGLPIGFSDHTIGTAIPLASIAMGACIIEKHFTIDKNLPGWDHLISADPNELKIIREEGDKIIKSLGSFCRIVSSAEEEKKLKFRRSIVYSKNLSIGHIITKQDITTKRPGTGVPPELIDTLIGRKLNTNIQGDSLLNWDQIC